METHLQLKITGTSATLRGLVQGFTELATGDWSRDLASEQDLDPGSVVCFTCRDTPGRPAATVYLGVRSEEIRLGNVMPCGDRHELSIAESNAAIESFYASVVRPATEGIGVHVEYSTPRQGPEDWFSESVAQLLRLFVVTANPNTAASHPMDEERWHAFIIAAHRERADVSGDTLARWLVADRKWPFDSAQQLGTEYSSGRSLLQQYDAPPGG